MASSPQYLAYRKKLRERNKARGVCPCCACRPLNGKSLCEVCRGRTKKCAEKRKQKSVQAGICMRCHTASVKEGRKHCEDCLRILSDNWREAREKNKAKGGCAQCGGVSVEGKKLCRRCIDRILASYHKHREKGVCVRCGSRRAKEGSIYCARCYDAARAAGKVGYKRLRELVFNAYGGFKCACCGEDEPEFLQMDHIDGGGTKHRNSLSSSSGFYRWLKKNGFPPGFQVLCANCNHAKGRLGICPHQRARNNAARKFLVNP